jgi:hypothetical protein
MNLPPTLYDDTYAGPRYRYGLTYRPLASANVPQGWIVFSDRPHPDFRHGTVAYARALTPLEINAYQLTPIELA